MWKHSLKKTNLNLNFKNTYIQTDDAQCKNSFVQAGVSMLTASHVLRLYYSSSPCEVTESNKNVREDPKNQKYFISLSLCCLI